MNSKKILSNQAGLHPRLAYTVTKHLETPYLKPYQNHNLHAFDALTSKIKYDQPTSIIMDSCCGTGRSTRTLARHFPNSLVIGVDRSFVRLNKQTTAPKNTLFLQANCEDIWRLCVANQIKIDHHFLLYPNPYPKAEHLMRRWHGHPALPYLPKLSRSLTLRSNWVTYLEEFALAWKLTTTEKLPIATLDAHHTKKHPLTLFERKYAESEQALYQFSTPLAPDLGALTSEANPP